VTDRVASEAAPNPQFWPLCDYRILGDGADSIPRPGRGGGLDRREDGRQRMLDTNVRQRDFYESRFESSASPKAIPERAANRPTRVWTSLRRSIMRMRYKAGADDRLLDLHRKWLGDLATARVLDLGCFDGNELSFWIAGQAREYIGVDLSEQAIAKLQQELRARNFPNATAIAMDFLANTWPDAYFDRVYAYSVLHHFDDLDVALRELRRIVKPGGVIVSMDPLATEPLNWVARAVYRPLQSSRDWEFPFDYGSLKAIGRYFTIRERRGVQGFVKLAYPFLAFRSTERIGRKLAARLLSFDDHRLPLSLPLVGPWHVTMKLERAGASDA
jgi:SAM-dependent methyltransferase